MRRSTPRAPILVVADAHHRRPLITHADGAKLLERMYDEAERMFGVHPHARQLPR